MMFKTKEFARLAKRTGFSDHDIREICNEINRGLLGASLGGGLFKKRFARPGAGKRGGYRVLLCTALRVVYFYYTSSPKVCERISRRKSKSL